MTVFKKSSIQRCLCGFLLIGFLISTNGISAFSESASESPPI